MIKIAICDDNKSICSEIEQILLEYKEENSVEMEVEVFYSGEEFINYMDKGNKFDLIFLDIDLNTTTGIEVSDKIRNKYENHIVKIVFITSNEGYERELFDFQPLNYIEKPLSHEKINDCINLTLKIINNEKTIFEYRKKGEIIKLPVEEILYFESIRKKVKIITYSGTDYFYDTLSNVKEHLPKTFVETHGSFLVNFHKIKILKRDSAEMINGDIVPISQRNAKAVRDKLINFVKERKDAGL